MKNSSLPWMGNQQSSDQYHFLQGSFCDPGYQRMCSPRTGCSLLSVIWAFLDLVSFPWSLEMPHKSPRSVFTNRVSLLSEPLTSKCVAVGQQDWAETLRLIFEAFQHCPGVGGMSWPHVLTLSEMGLFLAELWAGMLGAVRVLANSSYSFLFSQQKLLPLSNDF